MSADVARLPMRSIGLAPLFRTTALTAEVGRVVLGAEAESSTGAGSAEATWVRSSGGSGIGALGSPAEVEVVGRRG